MKIAASIQRENIKKAYESQLENLAKFDQSTQNIQEIKLIEYIKGRLDTLEAIMYMQDGNPVYIAGMIKYIP